MKKRVVSMVLALVMLCSLTVSAWAEDPIVASGQCGDSDTESRIQWLLLNTGKLEISGQGHMENYTYYSSAPWAGYKEQIKEVVIYGLQDELQSCVLSIGNYAFYGCANLTTVTIADTVAVIGSSAFGDCESLKEIAIPDSVGKIDGAFWGSGIESIRLPAGLTSIGENTFSGCENLKEVTLPESLTSIGRDAFSKSGLTRIVIPDSVSEIGQSAFSRCMELEYVRLPDALEELSEWLFYGSYKLKKVENISPTVKTISDSAFNKCISLESVEIPFGIETIGSHAFLWCESLPEITIPDSVKTIEISAFNYCKSLKEVTIPAGVTEIGRCAFAGCDSLQAVYVAEDNPAYQSVDGALLSKDGTTLYCCPGAKTGCYEIPEGVTTLERNSIFCPKLETLVFPSTVESAYYAVEGCLALTSCFFRGPGVEDFNNLRAYGATFYYIEGQPGWTSPTCYGHQTALWDGGSLIPGTLLDGDTNGDSKVDATDLQQLYGYLTGQVTLGMAQKMAADYNGDGMVDVYDLQALYEHLALQGTAQ